MMISLLSLLSCESPPEGDALIYVRALSEAQSLEEARGLCQQLTDLPNQEDCLISVSQIHNDLSVQLCEDLSGSRWEGECFFQLAERLQAADQQQESMKMCARSVYTNFCISHMMQQEVESVSHLPLSQAQAQLAPYKSAHAISEFFQSWFRSPAHRTRWSDSTCDGLSHAQECQDALREHMTLHVTVSWRNNTQTGCAQTDTWLPTSGQPTWTAGPLADQVWQQWQESHCEG